MRSDKPYSNLKAGQASLDRDYYSKATHEKPDGANVLKNFGRFDSIYNENVASTVKPEDYSKAGRQPNSMRKPTLLVNSAGHYEYAHNPELYKHSRESKIEEFKKTMSGEAPTNVLSNAGAT